MKALSSAQLFTPLPAKFRCPWRTGQTGGERENRADTRTRPLDPEPVMKHLKQNNAYEWDFFKNRVIAKVGQSFYASEKSMGAQWGNSRTLVSDCA